MSVGTAVSVPADSGLFVETLNNCGVLVLNSYQTHTHTGTRVHTHTHTHKAASELIWDDLPDQGTTETQ